MHYTSFNQLIFQPQGIFIISCLVLSLQLSFFQLNKKLIAQTKFFNRIYKERRYIYLVVLGHRPKKLRNRDDIIRIYSFPVLNSIITWSWNCVSIQTAGYWDGLDFEIGQRSRATACVHTLSTCTSLQKRIMHIWEFLTYLRNLNIP